jgi:hypothetical protein
LVSRVKRMGFGFGARVRPRSIKSMQTSICLKERTIRSSITSTAE